MSDEIKVTQAGMSALIDALRDAIQGIEAILRELDSKVSELRGGWSGEASEAYNRAQARWTAQLDEMNGLLARHRNDTIAGAELFKDAVAKNREIWS